jgi:AcrR family transcriptional regulator
MRGEMTRQEKALITKENIYTQTLHLINEKGYDNVLIEDITQTAGIAKGTFYYYFKSKEQLLYFTFKQTDKYYLEALEIAKKQVDYFKMIDVFVRESYIRIEALGKEVIRAICSNLCSPETRVAFLDKTRCLYTALKYIIQTGLENGYISNKHDTAFYVEKIVIMVVGIENYWVVAEQDDSLTEFAVSGINTLFRGFSKENN